MHPSYLRLTDRYAIPVKLRTPEHVTIVPLNMSTSCLSIINLLLRGVSKVKYELLPDISIFV